MSATARGPVSKLALVGATLVFAPVALLVLLSGGSILARPWAVVLLIGTPFVVAHVLFAVGVLVSHVAWFVVHRSGKRGRSLALASVLSAYAVIAVVVTSFKTADLVLGTLLFFF